MGWWRRAARFARSALVGGLATLADLGAIALLVGGFGLAPRVANLPSLLLGAAVQFVGNRRYAFAAERGSLGRQLAAFSLVEIVALALNALLYDLGARALPLGAAGAVVLRAVTSFAVFALWSYPSWRRVFRVPSKDRMAAAS
jgi:putative flippase GtrA